MIRLTKQEQTVLGVVLALLLTGWAVKAYRAAHPHADRPSPGQRAGTERPPPVSGAE